MLTGSLGVSGTELRGTVELARPVVVWGSFATLTSPQTTTALLCLSTVEQPSFNHARGGGIKGEGVAWQTPISFTFMVVGTPMSMKVYGMGCANPPP